MQARPVAVVVGAGTGLGSAIARRFAREGFAVCVARRNAEPLAVLCQEIESQGGMARAHPLDARSEEQVVSLFEQVEAQLGPVEVAVHNVGANLHLPVVETPLEGYRDLWELCCMSAFLTGREAARRMLPRGRGTLLFTGATASLRGGAGFAAFAGAKHALRALAQSLARELGPQGIHVAHVVVDGVIHTPWLRERFPQLLETRPEEALLSPDAIAESYWFLHCQERSAWTQELDLRPHVERW